MSFCYPNVLHKDNYTDECAISTDNFHDLAQKGDLVETSCTHRFSKISLKEWLKNKPTCPVCVTNIFDKPLIPVALKADAAAEVSIPSEDVLPLSYNIKEGRKFNIESTISKSGEEIVLNGKFKLKTTKKLSGKFYGVFKDNVLKSLTVTPGKKTKKKLKEKKIKKSLFKEMVKFSLFLIQEKIYKKSGPFSIDPNLKFDIKK